MHSKKGGKNKNKSKNRNNSVKKKMDDKSSNSKAATRK